MAIEDWTDMPNCTSNLPLCGHY